MSTIEPMSKNAIISIAISAALILGTLYFVSDTSAPSDDGAAQNTTIRDGVQYVDITARGGYTPRVSRATAGIPTKLVVTTDGTYDCSASLVVRSAGFQKILQPTGEEVIDVGTPQSGEKIQGTCGMGMYSFEIDFK